jgi:phage-related protein
MEKVRTIKLFKNYYKEFYVAQTFEVRDKINKVLKLIETQRMIPAKFFRIIEGSDGIYEIRIELGSNIYRIFCCFDEGAVVVLFHGFQKKSQKTPPKEIRHAEAIKKEYFKEKENKK